MKDSAAVKESVAVVCKVVDLYTNNRHHKFVKKVTSECAVFEPNRVHTLERWLERKRKKKLFFKLFTLLIFHFIGKEFCSET